jgi:LmbE family N-acetylglucosaminyl deacetylase
MKTLDFSMAPERVLCLGAHSDDIEIGCGGSILRLLHSYPHLEVRWAVFGARGERVAEAQRSAETMLAGAGSQEISVTGFRDGYFPSQIAEIKDHFESLKRSFQPDLIFTHYGRDAHQDHRVISELTWNTFRNHLILEYEIPKYDGDFGSPNAFIYLDSDVCSRKVEHLLTSFGTQRDKHWFTRDLFFATLRIRGMESNAPAGLAEAFYTRKIAL